MPNKLTWIVVCTELHYAIGTFDDAKEAAEVARELTDEQQCVFVPVPFSEGEEVEKPRSDHTRRGYL